MADGFRLSRSLSALREHYTVVVVGSGYGGSILASRLARARADNPLSVCLLERGRELHPGEFPRTVAEAFPHLQVSGSEGRFGDRQSLYSFHVGEGINVFSGCGLGGTSLVNANVSLCPERWVLEDPSWPADLRNDPASLDQGYEQAYEMLDPRTYPLSYPRLAKARVLGESAGTTKFYAPTITVTFTTGPNRVGVNQTACNGCGDCVTGCNVGAKNTLLMNYLPDAVAHGAEIFTEVDVKWVERTEDVWAVRYDPLGRDGQRRDGEPMTVTADIVVLAAGTLGTTGILLRSHEHGLALSAQLGTRFTGNGDILAFGVETRKAVHGVGYGKRRPAKRRVPGPCVTTMIDDRASKGPDGIVIQDAVIPAMLGRLTTLALAVNVLAHRRKRRPWLISRLGAVVRSFVTGGRSGSLDDTQTLLVMGHDDGHGRIELHEDRVRIDWDGVGTSAYYERANDQLHATAERGGGTYAPNPAWSKLLHHQLVTVHPLGGAPMGDSAETGVVNHKGEVFASSSGSAVHEGLYVSDGSMIPRPLGVNPLWTISALAERTASLLASDRGWTIDRTLPYAATRLPHATWTGYRSPPRRRFRSTPKRRLKSWSAHSAFVVRSVSSARSALAEQRATDTRRRAESVE
jgi:cholesterol oxidase